MTTTNPFSLRHPRPLRYLLALLATISLSACGGGDENSDQATGAPGASTPDASLSPSPASGDQDANPSEGTPIRITFGDTVLTARLHDNATARDLVEDLRAAPSFCGCPYQAGRGCTELPRILIPGTWVNKGKKKGRSC